VLRPLQGPADGQEDAAVAGSIVDVVVCRRDLRQRVRRAARHRDTQAALGRVHEAIARLRREKTPVSVAAVARRAGVSRTVVYTNPDAKTAVAKAVRESAESVGTIGHDDQVSAA
jgi:hypothetical protein